MTVLNLLIFELGSLNRNRDQGGGILLIIGIELEAEVDNLHLVIMVEGYLRFIHCFYFPTIQFRSEVTSF